MTTKLTPFQPPAHSVNPQIRRLQNAADNQFTKIGFALVLVFLFVDFSRILDFSLYQLHLPMILSSLALAAVVVGGGLFRSLSSKMGIVLICLSVWFVLSVPFSIWRGGSAGVLVNDWSRCFLIFPVVAGVLVTTAQVAKAIRWLAYALLVLALLALRIGVAPLGRLEMPGGFFANSNDLAMAMAMGLFCWWSFYRSKNKFLAVLALAAQVVLSLVLVKTGSRGVLIALTLTVPLLLMQYSMIGRLRLLAMLCVIVLVTVALAPARMLSRFSVIFSPDEEVRTKAEFDSNVSAAESADSRMYLLRRSIEITAENPIFGVGLGNFMVAENEKAKQAGTRGNWHGTHNTYTQLSSEAGIPALLLYIALFVYGWKTLNRVIATTRTHPQHHQILASASALKLFLMFMIAVCMFGHFAYLPFMPTLMGLIYGLSYSAAREMKLISGAAVPAMAPPRVQPNVWNRRLS